MKFVIDASVVVAVVLGEPEREWAIESTRKGMALAPRSLPFEIGNALTGLVKRRCLSPEGMYAAWTAASAFRVTLRDIDIGAALRVAAANSLYGYDAYMLQCATETKATLMTLDRRMAAVARSMGLVVLES